MTYDDSNRGKIQYQDHARQLLIYEGMTFGRITPTDIDGVIEYHDEAVILYECKHADAEIPRGQKIALVRIIDDLQAANKEAILLICEHHIARGDIRLANTIVREVYYKGSFHVPHNRTTAKEMTERFLNYVDNKKPPSGNWTADKMSVRETPDRKDN